MKSLKESLFEYDNTQTMESLFDTDLKEKELKLRDVYEAVNPNPQQVIGMPISVMFDIKKLSKYEHPYENISIAHTRAFEGLVGIIADMPAPDQNTINKSYLNYDWCQELLSKLSKYITKDWKWSFDEKFNVNLRGAAKNLIQVVFNYDEGTGIHIYTFKLINS